MPPGHQQPGRLQPRQHQAFFPLDQTQRHRCWGRRHRGQIRQGPGGDPTGQLAIGNGATEGQHAATTAIEPLMEGGHGGRIMGQQRLALAEDRLAIGMARTGLGQQALQRHLLRLILALGQLFEHHLALHGECFWLQPRVEHQIQQQIEGLRGRLRWNQHVVMNVVEAGGGIAIAAKGLHPAIELTGGQTLAALEHHVLKEVGQAALPRALPGAAGPAPKIQTHQW